MPGTTSTALPSFSHDQQHETDAAKRKGGGVSDRNDSGKNAESNGYRNEYLWRTKKCFIVQIRVCVCGILVIPSLRTLQHLIVTCEYARNVIN